MHSEPRDERFPVWDALSEFFLDTELDNRDYERISKILAKSKYSIKEMQAILYYEVYPACKWNLFSVAGEWAGFHADWIMKNIAPRKDKRPKLPVGPIHKWMFRDHWSRVSFLVEKHRLNKEQR
jgi:hypothetical protein